jgi:hypothetical protein
MSRLRARAADGWRWVVALAQTGPALLAAVVAWLAWRRLRRNLPIALFGGLGVWLLASWAITAVGTFGVS